MDASGWKDESDVWTAMSDALKFPDWHGRNLDALYDSLGGGINGREAPFALVVSGLATAGPRARDLVGMIAAVFDDARDYGIPVTLVERSR
ncbi:barstar family protein [Albidovulum sp.]|uniref:barstar family protein n=1 Tax=Albidovulum sp. TaxID=1872424 RepID=UPI003D7E07CC